MPFLDAWNDNPRSYVWSKTAGQILDIIPPLPPN